MDKLILHQVYFWLKDAASEQDREKLIAGLKTFSAIKEIVSMHIGVPASTEKRAVIDHSFSVSELLFFKTPEDQRIYQDHPVHQQFIKDCGDLWDKVIVYDSTEI